MAFALNHAVLYGLKRIIYVIPFTSIIEQNAAVFKECLGEENVLEHHSNFDLEKQANESSDDETNNACEKLKLAAENWDIPIVVTTNVQFFESLFANKKTRSRKLHNIAKSVIIFDEAQMLPRDYLQPCMCAIQELVQNYGTSAIFCTATQPALKQFFPNMPDFIELASDPKALTNFYKRVQIKNAGCLTDDELATRMNAIPQALCIVNTRKHAKGLFDGLIDDGRFHLSTLMCPMHRKEILATIRKRLQNGETCRVVSTQVMEAGIDVDFPTGFRAMAGLDSIIQASGRVNREGKRSIGEMVVFEPDSQFVQHTPVFIKQTAEVARCVLREFGNNPDSLDAINAYYKLLFSLQDGKRAFDIKGILAYFNDSDGFNFKKAAENFNFIENATIAIIIPYNEQAVSLIETLKKSLFPNSIVRKLQHYIVNIYENEFQALNQKGKIDFAAEKYAFLNDNKTYYDTQTGIKIPELQNGEAVFY